MKPVCIILANGFEDLEATGTIAILRRAGLVVDVYGLSDLPTGKYDIAIANSKPIHQLQPENYDLVILPGGPGHDLLRNHPFVIEILQQFYQDSKYIAAICAAPTILGELGMLEGRTYTCFPGMEDASFLGTYVTDKAVVDGNIITGRAAGAVTDFGLLIVKQLLGDVVANHVKETIYY